MRGYLNEALVLVEMKPTEDLRVKTIGKITTKILGKIISEASKWFFTNAEKFFTLLESKEQLLWVDV